MSETEEKEMHFDEFRRAWSEDLDLLRQNRLQNERKFLKFAKARGIRVAGVVTGDPTRFHEMGWLADDGRHPEGPLFHPFRIYPLYRIIKSCDLPFFPSATVDRAGVKAYFDRIIDHLPSLDDIRTNATQWNALVDLASLLEPIYWPGITGIRSFPGLGDRTDYEQRLEDYKGRVLDVVSALDCEEWRETHEHLRFEAAQLDPNGRLYLLLRLSSWSRRKKLKGRISGALWIRHMAEVLRRAFEEAHGVEWAEEDQATGTWMSGMRERAFGSERPLDSNVASKPYLAGDFGLFTGSVVRWYVEGETEFYAVRELLPGAPLGGIELVNLRGNIKGEKGNIALKLADCLNEDRRLRRFSIITFDKDVRANVRTIRQQVKKDNVVGYISAHDPDFEFANFSVGELVEIAARLDESAGQSGDELRDGDWEGIDSGRAFERRYLELSSRQPRSLKGKDWGEALANYAALNPDRDDSGEERPFLKAVSAALRSRTANYDYQAEHFRFDPDTFELIQIKANE